jgi:hypothetical protein
MEEVPPASVALVSQLVVVRQGGMALAVVRSAVMARLQHKAATLTTAAVMTVLLAKQASMVYATYNVVTWTKSPMRPRRVAWTAALGKFSSLTLVLTANKTHTSPRQLSASLAMLESIVE